MKSKRTTTNITIFIMLLLTIIATITGVLIFNMYSSVLKYKYSAQLDTVIIPSEIFDTLQNDYIISPDETIYCVYGTVNSTGFKIDYMTKPAIYEQTTSSVTYDTCEDSPFSLVNKQFVSTIHTHPSNICFPSAQDIYTFGQRDDIVMGIMCNNDKVVFFTKKQLDVSINVEVE